MSEYLTLSHHDQASPIYQNDFSGHPLLQNAYRHTSDSDYLAENENPSDRPSTSNAIPSTSNSRTQYQLLSECSETSV